MEVKNWSRSSEQLPSLAQMNGPALLIRSPVNTSKDHIICSQAHASTALGCLYTLPHHNSSFVKHINVLAKWATSFVLVQLLAVYVRLASPQLKIITRLYVGMLVPSGMDQGACVPWALVRLVAAVLHADITGRWDHVLVQGIVFNLFIT